MNLEVQSTHRAGFDEFFVTAIATGAAEARATFDAIAGALRAHRVEPIAEKIYGGATAREGILAARSAALQSHDLDPALPFTFVDGAPLGGGGFAGVQIQGVAGGGRPAVRTVPGGRLWQGPGFRALYLAGAHGRAGDCVTMQAEQMFAAAAAAAKQNRFDYAQTVRTWIYLARLLDWYGELNRVRSACYRQYDFRLPASTGIQGRSGDHECVMDALLVDGVLTHTIDRSRRQGPASAYGSSFSRATELAYEGGSTVYVSGTASIDGNGHSVHLGDPTAQFVEMVLGVAAVLAETGMGLADIRQATLFCKDARTLLACREARELLAMPAFPTVCVQADVCRHELLVELEAIASR
ncbi:MAG TPA: Rid family hydrolase [Planctomycetota bacterium]